MKEHVRPRSYRARYPYSPQKADELQMSVGDRIINIEDAGNGWVIGHNKTTGNTGLCPRDYLEERSASKSRLNRMRNRASTIYLNMTQRIPSQKSETIFTISKQDCSSMKSTLDLIDDDNGNNADESRSSARKLCFRTFVGLLGGIFLGGLLFVVLRLLYQYTVVVSGAVSGGITLVMCIGLLVSPHVRCLVALMSVTVFTGQGRVALLSLVPGLILTGPVMNIQRNINEGTNSVGCIVEGLFNQTVLIHQQLKASVTRQQENLEKSVQDLRVNVANATSELEGRNPVRNVTECLQRIKTMQDKCETSVRNARNVCVDAGTVHSSIQDRNKFRRQIRSFGNKCATTCRVLDPKILCAHPDGNELCTTPGRTRRSIVPTSNYLNQRLDRLLELNITGSKVVDFNANSSFNPVDKIREAEKEIQQRINRAIQIIQIVNRILIIFIILAFIKAGLYMRRYLRGIKFDNIYLTSQFKRLDKQLRKDDEQKAVLPLQKVEKKKYIDSTSIKLSQAEAFAWKVGMCQVLLQIVIATVFVLMDYSLFYLLVFVKQNGGTDIFVSGGAFLDVDIEGIGPVAEFIRSVFNGFNTTNGFQNVLNLKDCLPHPSEPSEKIVSFIGAIYILALLFVLFQAYGLRLRHKMMAFFFPERESERIHYIYRHILLKRRVRAEEKRKLNLLRDNWNIGEVTGLGKTC